MRWDFYSVTLAATKKSCGCLFGVIKAVLNEPNTVGWPDRGSLLKLIRAGNETNEERFATAREKRRAPSCLFRRRGDEVRGQRCIPRE